MKKIVLVLFFSIVYTSQVYSQGNYSRAKIYTTDNDLKILLNAGVTVDHGEHKKNTWYVSDFSLKELEIVKSLGIKYDILIEDVQKHYVDQNKNTNSSVKKQSQSCNNSIPEYTVPSNFKLGSMGGYFTYNEFIAHLDTMTSKFPNLITKRVPIDTFTTHENRPIYWLKISDNPSVDESEPEVLYTALHHAREPASLSQLIFYMYYLLENYATNSDIKALVDNTEMYFVPMINPDGYSYNESTNPNGGGMWRKNKRDNGDGTFGVDLNRNYSYKYGVSGVSTTTSSDVYLGLGAFSEPETQAIKRFTETREFKLALNYHTYSDLVLFPFGYDYVQCNDHSYFEKISSIMVEENNYINQQAVTLYPAAGDSDDWMYADESTKPKIFAMTPEIGSDGDGFWPPSSRIMELCKLNVFQNIMLPRLAGKYAIANDLSSTLLGTKSGNLPFSIERLGLNPSGTFTVDFTPLNNTISFSGSPKTYTGLNISNLVMDSISYQIGSSVVDGNEISYVMSVDNGVYVIRDTIRKVYGQITLANSNNGNTLTNWKTNSWSVSTSIFHSPSASITDSPNGDYKSNTNSFVDLKGVVDMTNSIFANISFWARWDIEENYDYVQVMVSEDSLLWTPLCGLYTNPGTDNQDYDKPVYDGKQSEWVKEELNLNDFLGKKVVLRFRLTSDTFENRDGFYFDDLEVKMIDTAKTKVGSVESVKSAVSISVFPNPASSYIRLNYNGFKGSKQIALYIYDALGKKVYTATLDEAKNTFDFSTNELKTGVYFYRVVSEQTQSDTKQMLIVK